MRNGEERMDEWLRDRLEQYAPDPPDRVWQGVRAGLATPGPGNRLIYLRWLAAAAVLLVAVVTGILLIGPPESLQPTVTEQVSGPEIFRALPSETIPEAVVDPAEAPVLLAAEDPGSRPSSLTASAPEVLSQPVSELFPKRRAEAGFMISAIRTAIYNDLRIAELIPSEKKETIYADHLSAADRFIIAGNASRSSVTVAGNESTWKVGVHVSPGYASHTASHSAGYANNMTYSGDDAYANVGGGFSVQYKTASRWRVESGVYYAQSGGNAGNALHPGSLRADFASAPLSAEKYFNTGVTMSRGQLNMNSVAGVIHFSHTPADAELISLPEASLGLNTAMLTPGEFAQIFDFVEVPLFARYQVVASRLDVELVGGMSTHFVVGNQVFMNSHAGRELVGSTGDITTVSFSGNAGVGLIYALGKNLSVSMEPRFSYHLSSINHSRDVSFKPWRVGVFTGMSYEF